MVRHDAHLAELAVRGYRAALDALQRLPEIGADGPLGRFGRFGLTMGTALGVPLMAAEPRITAAVFGPHWPDAPVEHAGRITVPVGFDLRWDDERIPRGAGLALFDAFASTERTPHADSGRHKALPRFEADGAARFRARHLGRPTADPGRPWPALAAPGRLGRSRPDPVSRPDPADLGARRLPAGRPGRVPPVPSDQAAASREISAATASGSAGTVTRATPSRPGWVPTRTECPALRSRSRSLMSLPKAS